MPARVVITWERESVAQAQNVLYFGGPTPTQGNLEDLADRVRQTWVDSDLRDNWISSTWRLGLVSAFDVDDATLFAEVGPSGGGQASPDALPAYCTIAVRHNTGPGSRNGRSFMPGYSEAASAADGRPEDGVGSDTVDFFNDIRTDAAGLGVPWDLGVRQASGTLSAVLSSSRSPSSSSLGWQTQRRRRRAVRL